VDVADDGPVEHGYPHLDTVRDAITALYKRLSYDTVQTFATSVAPVDVAFGDTDDLHLGASAYAMVEAAYGISMILGSLTVGRLGARLVHKVKLSLQQAWEERP